MADWFAQVQTQVESLVGLGVAGAVLGLWLSSFVALTSIDVSKNISLFSLAWVGLAILARTFLQTGLFIVAHDAMHRAVYPANRRWNDGVGTLALGLYALLSYRRLLEQHWQHHRQPGRVGDPDFHDGQHPRFWAWYIHFMQRYLDKRQVGILFGGMGVLFYTFVWPLHLPMLSVMLFWVLPMLFSSLQLFYFGTYLPHREPSTGYDNAHHASSSGYPVWWSFLTCYHFGYHWEHHEYPHLPWYALPSVRGDRPEG